MTQPERLRKRLGEMSASQLVLLIIVLFSSIVVILLFARFKQNYDTSASLTCPAQVREAHFRQRTLPGAPLEITHCQEDVIDIKRTDYPKDWQKADPLIKKTIADAMLKCWTDWGEGELQLFPKEGAYCSMCASIRFDEATQKLYAENENGRIELGPYLATNKTPAGATYSKQISHVNDDELPPIAQTMFFIDPGKPQVILFAQMQYPKNKDLVGKIFGESLTPMQGAGAGAAGVGSVVAFIGSGIFSGGTTVVLTGAAAVGGAVHGYMRGLEMNDMYTQSAMYITAYDPKSPYVQFCEQLGAPSVSP